MSRPCPGRGSPAGRGLLHGTGSSHQLGDRQVHAVHDDRVRVHRTKCRYRVLTPDHGLRPQAHEPIQKIPHTPSVRGGSHPAKLRLRRTCHPGSRAADAAPARDIVRGLDGLTVVPRWPRHRDGTGRRTVDPGTAPMIRVVIQPSDWSGRDAEPDDQHGARRRRTTRPGSHERRVPLPRAARRTTVNTVPTTARGQ